MPTATADFEREETEDLILMSIRMDGKEVQTAGITASGDVYLRGDIHPSGSASALLVSALQGVPHVNVSAVEVLYPADWLKGECLHDLDRLRIIAQGEREVRTAASRHAQDIAREKWAEPVGKH